MLSPANKPAHAGALTLAARSERLDEGVIVLDWQENCSACSQVPQDLQFPPSAKLQEVLDYLTESASL